MIIFVSSSYVRDLSYEDTHISYDSLCFFFSFAFVVCGRTGGARESRELIISHYAARSAVVVWCKSTAEICLRSADKIENNGDMAGTSAPFLVRLSCVRNIVAQPLT
jgi:hypothetical protein